MQSKKINCLSLFDGISIARLALERANIPIDKYYASEIEDTAIAISKKNWNDIIHIGDVRNIDATQYQDIGLFIGGSPCTQFSSAGTRKGMSTNNNQDITSLEQYLELKAKNTEFHGQSYLFWEYIRLLREVKPKYFMLENVKMAKKWQDIITAEVGVEPIMINSALVSAQDRKRLYWTNIPGVIQPEDKHIYLDDIIQEDIEHKILPRTRLDYTNYDKNKVDKSVHKYTATSIGNSKNFGNSVRSNGKAFTLRRICPNGVICPNGDIRTFSPIEAEKLQTVPENYTYVEGIRDKDRYAALGNSWTADVISHIFSFIPKEED